jgi:hypothetical protein
MMVWNGNESGKPEVMRISIQEFPVQIMMNQRHPENVEYFKCLGSAITNYAKCTHDVRYVIVIVKVAFKKNVTFHKQIGLKFKDETSELLHWEYSFVCC